MLISPQPQPSKPKTVHHFIGVDRGSKDSSVAVRGHKAGDIIFIDELSECTPEMYDEIVQTYGKSSTPTRSQSPETGSLFARFDY